MGKIFWLASYPKSGNTWLRIFLTNYWRDGDEPADINQLDATPIASSRMLFDDSMGLEASDLTADEIDFYRPAVYRALAMNQSNMLFMKVHDAYTYLPDGRALFPPEVTAGAVYIVRNPLDVAVSFAAHNGYAVARVVAEMAQESFTFYKQHSLSEQLRQQLCSWSGHVRSWLDQSSGFPICVIRYEDMQQRPVESFSQVIRFIGENEDEQRLHKALRFSRFDLLQQQEHMHGFQERSGYATTFFRKGQVDTWRDQLCPKQVAQIRADHSEMMQRFGYL